MQVSSCDERKPETRKTVSDSGTVSMQRLGLARNGMNLVICPRTTTYIDPATMKLPKFLRPPKIYRRNRSKARSEISPIDGQNEVDPAAPRRPSESAPDLGVGTSILPAPSPFTPHVHDRESNGTGTVLFQSIYLSLSLRTTQIPTPAPAESHLSPEETRAASQSLQPTPPTQEQHPGANRIGSPPRTPQPSWPSTW